MLRLKLNHVSKKDPSVMEHLDLHFKDSHLKIIAIIWPEETWLPR